jgi:hypothetical protein
MAVPKENWVNEKRLIQQTKIVESIVFMMVIQVAIYHFLTFEKNKDEIVNNILIFQFLPKEGK